MSFQLHTWLPQQWLRRGAAARLLWPLSMLYRGAWALQRMCHAHGWQPQQHLPVPVLVIGNVVAGGAGKTPTAIAVVKHLLSQGWRVGVVSRGHGRRQSQVVRPVTAYDDPCLVGDEPLLIHKATGVPVHVGAQRVAAARQLLNQHPDTDLIVCDDGLQHLTLARDLDICVMDERGVGNGWLLPAGPLREPWPRPVDLLLHTGPPAVAGGWRAQRQLAKTARNARGETVTLASLRGQSVDAVAGLARPQAFFDMLQEAGLSLNHTHALADHADFSQWPQAPLQRPLLCTEKDADKLWARQPEALAVGLELDIEAGFWRALDARLAPLRPTTQGAPLSSPHGQQTP